MFGQNFEEREHRWETGDDEGTVELATVENINNFSGLQSWVNFYVLLQASDSHKIERGVLGYQIGNEREARNGAGDGAVARFSQVWLQLTQDPQLT